MKEIILPVRPAKIWNVFHKLKYGSLIILDAEDKIICKCFSRKQQMSIVSALNKQYNYTPEPNEVVDKLRNLVDVIIEKWDFETDEVDPIIIINQAIEIIENEKIS